MSDENRMDWLDSLRLLAGISIVGVHSSSDFSGQPFVDFTAAERVFPVLFRSVIYMARTELFLIISLFLLIMALDRRPRSYRVMLGQQSRRLLLPFAFWVVFYAFYRLIKADAFNYQPVILAELTSPSAWAGYFLLGDVQYHMHFLPTLFALVLCVPLFQIAVRYPALGLIVLICLLIKREVDVWLWGNLANIAGFDYLLRGVKILTYLGYGFVAASFYGIVKAGISAEIGRKLALVVLFLGSLLYVIKLIYSYRVILAGNWQYNDTAAYWADFLMPAVLFAGFMFMGRGLAPAIVRKLAPFSFGIYLVHPILLDLIEIAIAPLDFSPSAMVLTKFFGGLTGASLLVYILSRSRLLAWTIGLGPLPQIPNLPWGRSRQSPPHTPS